jgi:hypothetical protein
MVVRPVPGQPDTSTFQWLLELDYGGWVPACLVNLFLPFAQVQQVSFYGFFNMVLKILMWVKNPVKFFITLFNFAI